MFDENPPQVEASKEPTLRLRDFLLAETPLSILKEPARFLAETWHMTTMDGEPQLRTWQEIFDANEDGFQGFLDGMVNRFTKAEANSLKFQVSAGLIKEPTDDQKSKIAKATD